MAVPLALPAGLNSLLARVKLPQGLPPLGRRTAQVVALLWFALFALAVAAPVAGIYERFTVSAQNSALIPGSRAGLALSEDDGTKIRFPVGPATSAMGIKPGDEIVSIDGMPVSDVVPISERAIAEGRGPSEADFIAFADILYGTEPNTTQIRIRARDGTERDVAIKLGEHHVESGARALWLSPLLLSAVDLPHVLAYPFLLAVAWVLRRRKPRDPVSIVISLAILLRLTTELPAVAFLESIGLPRPLLLPLYDLSNMALLAGVLLFPHGRFTPRAVLPILLALPILFLLKGDVYKAALISFTLLAVLVLVRRLRDTPPSDARQQIKWALFGFSGYALFQAITLALDMLKPGAASLAQQLLFETFAGLALGLAFLSLQLGLTVALLRYRLYDAEVVISRSASFAIVTILLAAAVAGVVEGIIETMQDAFGDEVGTGAAVIGAAMATVLINPLHERIQAWAERRFNANLLQLRQELPECVRDLREVVSLPELLQEVLGRVRNGVRTVRAAFVVEGTVREASGISMEDAANWLAGFTPHITDEKIECDPEDSTFPIRLPLCCGGQLCLGWLLVGPRPDGSSLARDEQETLMEVADPVARAIRIVLKRDSQDKEIADLLESHRRRIEELEARLTAAATKPQPVAAAGGFRLSVPK